VERDSQLDSTGRTSADFSLVPATFQFLIPSLLIVLFALLLPTRAAAQCAANFQDGVAVHELYRQQEWNEVAAAAERLSSRSADVNFDLGMAFAHLQQWDHARTALLAGRRQCPHQKRFPIELAGVAFQQKRYPDAALWIEKGLRLDPKDQYANDFAGTVFLLMDNLDAALNYWNRIQRPKLDALQIDPQLRVERLLLERAFVFSPQAEMKRADMLSSEARLEAMGVFPAYSIKLDARPDGNFEAQFHAIERNGFGNGWLQSAVSIFSGLPYKTVYPSYFNIGRSATNFDSLVRWDAQKRRVWLSLAGPWHGLPQRRWQVAADGRDENWAIRDSFTGAAPVVGSFKLKRELATATITSIHSGRMQWTTGGEFSHRTYSDVASGSALTADLITPGFELKHLAGLNTRLVDLPEHRFIMSSSASSELARLWSSPARLYEKAQGSATIRWFPQAEGDRYELIQRLRGGGIAGSAPVDELWLVGVERDTDLWLRGHIGTRDGRKGSAPMADRYFLSNTDLYRSVWGNGLISIKAGPLFDFARIAGPTSALAPRQWLFDAGAEVKLSVLGTGVVLTYGRDLRNGNNAFYGSVAQH
jgi:tetratricopeptide (TPR) repeat protein